MAKKATQDLKDISSKQVLDALVGASKIIKTEKQWVYGRLAEDKDGKEVDLLSEKAIKFCASAAIQRFLKEHDEPIYKAAITELNVTVGKLYPKFSHVESMNDGAKTDKDGEEICDPKGFGRVKR